MNVIYLLLFYTAVTGVVSTQTPLFQWEKVENLPKTEVKSDLINININQVNREQSLKVLTLIYTQAYKDMIYLTSQDQTNLLAVIIWWIKEHEHNYNALEKTMTDISILEPDYRTKMDDMITDLKNIKKHINDIMDSHNKTELQTSKIKSDNNHTKVSIDSIKRGFKRLDNLITGLQNQTTRALNDDRIIDYHKRTNQSIDGLKTELKTMSDYHKLTNKTIDGLKTELKTELKTMSDNHKHTNQSIESLKTELKTELKTMSDYHKHTNESIDGLKTELKTMSTKVFVVEEIGRVMNIINSSMVNDGIHTNQVLTNSTLEGIFSRLSSMDVLMSSLRANITIQLYTTESIQSLKHKVDELYDTIPETQNRTDSSLKCIKRKQGIIVDHIKYNYGRCISLFTDISTRVDSYFGNLSDLARTTNKTITTKDKAVHAKLADLMSMSASSIATLNKTTDQKISDLMSMTASSIATLNRTIEQKISDMMSIVSKPNTASSAPVTLANPAKENVSLLITHMNNTLNAGLTKINTVLLDVLFVLHKKYTDVQEIVNRTLHDHNLLEHTVKNISIRLANTDNKLNILERENKDKSDKIEELSNLTAALLRRMDEYDKKAAAPVKCTCENEIKSLRESLNEIKSESTQIDNRVAEVSDKTKKQCNKIRTLNAKLKKSIDTVNWLVSNTNTLFNITKSEIIRHLSDSISQRVNIDVRFILTSMFGDAVERQLDSLSRAISLDLFENTKDAFELRDVLRILHDLTQSPDTETRNKLISMFDARVEAMRCEYEKRNPDPHTNNESNRGQGEGNIAIDISVN